MALDRTRASAETRFVAASTVINQSTPDGLRLAYELGAREFLLCARKLDKDCSGSTGEYVLTFHAVELALKAFLAQRGVSKEVLRFRPYGHDLSSLYEAAQQRGMLLNISDAKETLAWANEWHHDDAKLRYEFIDERTLPICATLFPLVEAIITAASA